MKTLSQIAKENGRDVSEFAKLPRVSLPELEDIYQEHLDKSRDNVSMWGRKYALGALLRKGDPERFHACLDTYLEEYGTWCLCDTSLSPRNAYVRMSDVEKILNAPRKKKVWLVWGKDWPSEASRILFALTHEPSTDERKAARLRSPSDTFSTWVQEVEVEE
jgi:hypothetical protein